MFPNGDVAVAGGTNGLIGAASFGGDDIYVQKYGASGALAWSQQIGGSSNDTSRAVATDSAGNVYVAGQCLYAAGGFDGHASVGASDICVVKFGSDGTKLGSNLVGGAQDDIAYAIAVDDVNGAVYVAGTTSSATFDGVTLVGLTDAVVLKFSAGTLALVDHFQYGVSGANVLFRGVALDSAKNVWVAGTTDAATYYSQPNNGSYDILLQKLSPAGAVLVTTLVGGTDADGAWAVTIDPMDNVYTAGSSRSWGDNVQDMMMNLFTSDGVRAMTVLAGGTGEDTAYSISVDVSHGVAYVGGQVKSSDLYGFPNPAGSAAAVLMFSLVDASTLYYSLYPGSDDSTVNQICNNGGTINVVGSYSGSFEGQAATGALSEAYFMQLAGFPPVPTNTPVATPTAAPSDTSSDAPVATPTAAPSDAPTDAPVATPTVAPSDAPTDAPVATPTAVPSASLTAAPTVFAYDVQRVSMGTVDTNGKYAVGSAIMSNGDLALSGSTTTNNFYVERFDRDSGSVLWTTKIFAWGGTSPSAEMKGAAVDQDDNVYVVGACKGNKYDNINLQGVRDLCISKLNSAGTKLYSIVAGGSGQDLGEGIAVDNNKGVFYVCGYTGSPVFDGVNKIGAGDGFVIKYAFNGTKLAHYQHTITIGSNTKASVQYRDIALDSDGDIFVSGASGTTGMDRYMVRKISATDGSVVWTQQLGGSAYDQSFGVAVDSSGYVYTTGFSRSNTVGGNQDIMVVKMANSGGSVQWTKYLGGGSNEVGRNLIVDSPRNVVYVVGETFISGTETAVFYALQTSNGNTQYSQTYPGSTSSYAENVVTNGEEIYIVGDFKGSFEGMSSTGSTTNPFMMQLEGYPSSSRRLTIVNTIVGEVEVFANSTVVLGFVFAILVLFSVCTLRVSKKEIAAPITSVGITDDSQSVV
jgi:hypothetical protein